MTSCSCTRSSVRYTISVLFALCRSRVVSLSSTCFSFHSSLSEHLGRPATVIWIISRRSTWVTSEGGSRKVSCGGGVQCLWSYSDSTCSRRPTAARDHRSGTRPLSFWPCAAERWSVCLPDVSPSTPVCQNTHDDPSQLCGQVPTYPLQVRIHITTRCDNTSPDGRCTSGAKPCCSRCTSHCRCRRRLLDYRLLHMWCCGPTQVQ